VLLSSEAANGGANELFCTCQEALDKLLNNFAESIKFLPGSLKMRKGLNIFRNFPADINICQEARGKEAKIFKKFLAEHIKFLPGSLKRSKSGQNFPNFLVDTCDITRTIFFV